MFPAATDRGLVLYVDAVFGDNRSNDCSIPLIDARVLVTLSRDLENPDAAVAFARDFAGSWPERSAKIREAITARNQDAGLDAILSLRTGSLMIGASRLARLVIVAEGHLRNGDFDNTLAMLPLVESCGAETLDVLENLSHGCARAD